MGLFTSYSFVSFSSRHPPSTSDWLTYLEAQTRGFYQPIPKKQHAVWTNW